MSCSCSTFPSALVVLTTLPMVLMKRSASPFASGHSGVIFRCLKPREEAKSANCFPLNGGPLSVRMTSGIPNVEKMSSSFDLTYLKDVDFMVCTIGKRE